MKQISMKSVNIALHASDITDWEVESDIGWVPISNCMVTKKFRKFLIIFESGIEIECADQHAFIKENGSEVWAKNLIIGDKINAKFGIDTVFDVFDTEIDENFFDISLEHHYLYYTNDILSHNSLGMINIATRQVLLGHNIVFFTLEMSEDMVNQRIDSVLSGLDINRIYVDKKSEVTSALKEVKNTENKGLLIVKEYPTKSASVSTLKSFLHEMEYRGHKFDACYIDYLNLMRPIRMGKNEDDSLYSSNKQISEEVRALSFEWEFPVITATQFNRGGAKAEFDTLSTEDVSESYGLSMTCDWALALGFDVDSAIYKNEISAKIIKNRHGGRVGESYRYYYDPKSLKIYDATELNDFFNDAMKSGCSDRPVNDKGGKPKQWKK
jgi:hypothetical protein